jgi:hypothetical protein
MIWKSVVAVGHPADGAMEVPTRLGKAIAFSLGLWLRRGIAFLLAEVRIGKVDGRKVRGR